MNKNYILIGVFVSIIVFGFGYQSYVTMHDTETSSETEQRLMREGERALGIQKEASSSGAMVASGTLPMEDGVIVATDSMMQK
jgi:hypothetical protein